MNKSNYQNEEKLLEQLAGGDDRVWKDFYHDVREVFCGHFIKYARINPSQALELLHEAMVILHRKAVNGSLKAPLQSRLSTFLVGIGKNLCRRKGFSVADEGEESMMHLADNWINEHEDAEENAAIVKSILGKIGEPCKTLLTLYYLEGYSMEAVASNMDMPSSGAAKKKKFDCLKAIRQMLG
ncbi:MAG: sigma-70 family RNA polymerase sigma factor [Saprospiraceae bacterium]|nr:sigma-70 family RNA polymerase sigma factor [Saprospiraceae bacterium]MCB9323558.1 sigma-70 family RNA polymerase sigma factor [Lewinellaceae bacterium]